MQNQHKQIDNYKIIKTIGKGSFSVVLLAEHKQLKIKVAIKKTLKRRSTINENSIYYHNEINILWNMYHNNIIKYYDHIEDMKSLSIVLEYAPNGDFFSLMQTKQQLNEKEAWFYFRQLLNGISYCHGKGVAHRDLKLENLLLSEQNELKIIDFGLSEYFNDGRFFSKGCGTIRYMDPEILKKNVYSGELCDVWSCGVILYVFLHGVFPFDDDVDSYILRKILRRDIRFNPDLSKDVVDLISMMLQVDIQKRISLQEIIQHKWIVYQDMSYQINFTFQNISSEQNRKDELWNNNPLFCQNKICHDVFLRHLKEYNFDVVIKLIQNENWFVNYRILLAQKQNQIPLEKKYVQKNFIMDVIKENRYLM